MTPSRLHILFAVAVALLAAAPVRAAPALTHLPAQFQGKDVFLLVAINGGRPVWMKLDIDGAPSSVSPQAAGDLGLRQRSGVALRIGAVGLSDVALRTEIAATCIGPDGRPPAGVLGIDALGDRPLWIDTKHRQVWISQPPSAADAGLSG